MDELDLQILCSNYLLSVLFLCANVMQENMVISLAYLREIIINNDTFMENYIVYIEWYINEKFLHHQKRSIWMKNRDIGWWENIVPHFDADDFRENFRMSRKTFDYICTQLENVLEPKMNPLMPRVPISVKKQVGIAIFFYASCCEFRVIAHLFGVHNTSVWRCIHKVTEAINTILMPTWITIPDERECEKIAKEFERITGMPNLIGALDGSHIPITPPSHGYRDFINRKGWPSYILQGLVDNALRFRNINIEFPGCNHDANVFKNSELFQNYHQLICQKRKYINGVLIPYLIMGDPAYPLLPWLIKGFVQSESRTEKEESFNVYLNSGRVKVELAFGRLKSRWRRLSKRIDAHYTFVPQLVAACCVLHNILETRKCAYNKMWDKPRVSDNLLYVQPEPIPEEETSNEAKVIRNILVEVVSKLPLRKSFH